MTPLSSQNFTTCYNRFFTKTFLPHFGRWGAHVMTLPNQLVPKQIVNLKNLQQKSSNIYLPGLNHAEQYSI